MNKMKLESSYKSLKSCELDERELSLETPKRPVKRIKPIKQKSPESPNVYLKYLSRKNEIKSGRRNNYHDQSKQSTATWHAQTENSVKKECFDEIDQKYQQRQKQHLMYLKNMSKSRSRSNYSKSPRSGCSPNSQTLGNLNGSSTYKSMRDTTHIIQDYNQHRQQMNGFLSTQEKQQKIQDAEIMKKKFLKRLYTKTEMAYSSQKFENGDRSPAARISIIPDQPSTLREQNFKCTNDYRTYSVQDQNDGYQSEPNSHQNLTKRSKKSFVSFQSSASKKSSKSSKKAAKYVKIKKTPNNQYKTSLQSKRTKASMIELRQRAKSVVNLNKRNSNFTKSKATFSNLNKKQLNKSSSVKFKVIKLKKSQKSNSRVSRSMRRNSVKTLSRNSQGHSRGGSVTSTLQILNMKDGVIEKYHNGEFEKQERYISTKQLHAPLRSRSRSPMLNSFDHLGGATEDRRGTATFQSQADLPKYFEDKKCQPKILKNRSSYGLLKNEKSQKNFKISDPSLQNQSAFQGQYADEPETRQKKNSRMKSISSNGGTTDRVNIQKLQSELKLARAEIKQNQMYKFQLRDLQKQQEKLKQKLKESEELRKEQQTLIENQHKKAQKQKQSLKQAQKENRILSEKVTKQASQVRLTQSKQFRQPLVPAESYLQSLEPPGLKHKLSQTSKADIEKYQSTAATQFSIGRRKNSSIKNTTKPSVFASSKSSILKTAGSPFRKDKSYGVSSIKQQLNKDLQSTNFSYQSIQLQQIQNR